MGVIPPDGVTDYEKGVYQQGLKSIRNGYQPHRTLP